MAKSLSKEEILHLAKLAGLSLDNKEVEKYKAQLTETLDYIENLGQLKVGEKEPTASPVRNNNVSFEDGERNSRGLTPDQVFSNSKNKKNNFFKVKKIF